MRRLCFLLLAFPIASLAQDAPDEDKEWTVKLARGTTPQLSAKPAEIFYLSENEESSSALNAALIAGFEPAILRSATFNSKFTVGAAVAKTNLKSKPQDLRSLDAAVRTIWTPSGGSGVRALEAYLSFSKEEDRIKGAKGHKEQFDLSVTGLCPAPAYDAKRLGFEIACYPYIGAYRRNVSQTADLAAAPLGRYGGPYAGFLLNISLGTVTDKGAWWAPLALAVDAYKLRDSYATGGYVKQDYKYASLTLSYALYSSRTSKWKPTISLIREVGTNRLNNEEHVALTKLALQVSYTN
jgi:hypothetical protein